MTLPPSKIDKLLEHFESSDDEELDEMTDDEGEFYESQSDSEPENVKNYLNFQNKNKIVETADKKNMKDLVKENEEEVKVVELKVEPIEIDDSGSECENLNIGKKVFSEDKNMKSCKKLKRTQKLIKEDKYNHSKLKKEAKKKYKDLKQNFEVEIEKQNNGKIFNSKRPVKCPICNRAFSRTDNMKSHMEVHINQCILCNVNFEFRKDFIQHMKEVHNRIKKVKDICVLCDEKFKNRIDYNAHIKNVHGVIIDLFHKENTRKNRARVERNLNCKECNLRMKNEQLFMLHMQIHDNRKETECVLCNKEFENVEAVLDHYGSFDKNKEDDHYIKMRPFSCHLCVVRYKNRRDLNDHLDVHAGKRRYLCPICGKQFSKKCNMQTHVKLHDKIYHSCCNKKFRNAIELETHQRNVHGDNNLICSVCNKAFSRRDNMKAHMETHLKWKCILCNTNFAFRRDFNRHMRVVHNRVKKHICSVCGKVFLLRYNYKKHMESHNRIKDKCVSCDKEFRNHRDYNAHMRNIHGEVIDVPKKNSKTNSRLKNNTK